MAAIRRCRPPVLPPYGSSGWCAISGGMRRSAGSIRGLGSIMGTGRSARHWRCIPGRLDAPRHRNSVSRGARPISAGSVPRRNRAGRASASRHPRRNHRAVGGAAGLHAQGHADAHAGQVARAARLRRAPGRRGDGRALDCLRSCGEAALACDVPARALVWRDVMAEFERIAGHLDALAAMAKALEPRLRRPNSRGMARRSVARQISRSVIA